MLRLISMTSAVAALLSALFLISSDAVSAAPMQMVLLEPRDEPIRYIIKYKATANVARAARPQWLKSTYNRANLKMAPSVHASLKLQWNRKVFDGFSGRLHLAAVNAMRKDPGVEYIVEDTRMYASKLVKRTNAPWGLARLSHRDALEEGSDAASRNFTYVFDDSAGQGVDVYVVDTGIRTTHKQFGGRATWGTTFGNGTKNEDVDGHGTHCAGTIAGKTTGVARNANVIAVKVLGDDGSGFTSDIISGISFAMQGAVNTTRPSIISMSLGGDPSRALDDAVRGAVSAGVHVVVAAGNEGKDATTSSPARVKEAITVGAADITDAVADFSNYGSLVDVFGPGVDIISASNKGDDQYQSLSGTSMATPHIAGLAAYLIALEGNRAPADLQARIKALASPDLLTAMPANGTINSLAFNGAGLEPVNATKPVPPVVMPVPPTAPAAPAA